MAQIVLVLFPLGLILVLLGISINRKLYTRFRFFVAYCVAVVCGTCLCLALDGFPLPYFVAYWLTDALYWILAVLAMFSLFADSVVKVIRESDSPDAVGVQQEVIFFLPLSRPLHTGKRWPRFMLLFSACVVAAVCFSFAVFTPIARTAVGRFASAIYAFVTLMCVVELMLGILALVVQRYLPVVWSAYEFGILVGFGLLGLLNLVAYTAVVLRLLHFSIGQGLENLFRSFTPAAFIGSAIVWLIAFWRPEQPRRPLGVGELHARRKLGREQLALLKAIERNLGIGSRS